MIKLNFKMIIFVVGIVFMLVSINKKYGKYKEILNNRKILIENKRNLESKIVNGYRLKYIHFTVYGSLNDFGKFVYFVNKSRKYIDTSKMFMELTSDGFKISLGFIEKVEDRSKISI